MKGFSDENDFHDINILSNLNVPYTICEIIVSIAAIIGNTLVIVAFKRERKLRRRTNYYIISLAVADFLVGLVGIPCAILASVGLPRHLEACLFTVSLLVVFCTVSIFSLFAVSADKYWAILYPMSYSTHINSRVTLRIIGGCWILGALIGFLPLLGWNASPVTKPVQCIFTKVMHYDYLVFLYFATIIFPAIFLAVFYTHIYNVILKQLRQMVSMNEYGNMIGGNHLNQHSSVSLRILGEARKKEVKATQNLSIIVLFFVICWIPLYTINCIQAFCSHCIIPKTLTDLCIILSHLNSAGNPLLYAYHLSDFRNAFRAVLIGSSSSVEENPIPLGNADDKLVVNNNQNKKFPLLSLNASKLSFHKKKPSKLFLFDSTAKNNETYKYTNPEYSSDCDGVGIDHNSNNNYRFKLKTNQNVEENDEYSEIENIDIRNNIDNNNYRNHSTNSYGYISINNDVNYYDNHVFVREASIKYKKQISDDNSYIVLTDFTVNTQNSRI